VIAGGALAVINAYLLGLLGAAASRPRAAPPGAPPRLRFAVVIPARDEEETIATTLAGLAAIDYPRELVETIVVADNCTDGTATIAARAGATVWPRRGGGGKGGALAWALRRLRDVDAVVVVDADCDVTANLLTAIEARMREGANVVQVAYLVGNADASAVAALRYASFALVNVVRPIGKARLGLSAGLLGTGMAFRTELLALQPWVARSLVEDQEQHLRLVAAGERVVFAPEARVVSAMPTTLRRSSSQLLRWDAGRARLIRTWTPRLLADGLRRRDVAQLHAALEPLVPPQSLLLAANLAAALRGGRLAACNLAAQVAFVAGGLALVRAPAAVWRSLACAPALVAWKLALLVRLWAGQGPTQWIRTEREPQRSRPAIRRS
jgi:1,2-diacylglycerol 3-beta-glucosyltransferase